MIGARKSRPIVMQLRLHRGGRLLAVACALWCAGWSVAQAALVDLDAYVSYAIYDSTTTVPIPHGAVVYIYGSGDNTINPMQTVGGPTNYVAGSATGDDIVLGVARIGDNVTSNGTFFTTVQYESTQINYVYIRFYDYTGTLPVTGLVYWGASSNFFLGSPTLGVSTVDFNPGGTIASTNLNNFVAIPEPSTANLIVLVAGMAWALRVNARGRKRGRGPT